MDGFPCRWWCVQLRYIVDFTKWNEMKPGKLKSHFRNMFVCDEQWHFRVRMIIIIQFIRKNKILKTKTERKKNGNMCSMIFRDSVFLFFWTWVTHRWTKMYDKLKKNNNEKTLELKNPRKRWVDKLRSCLFASIKPNKLCTGFFCLNRTGLFVCFVVFVFSSLYFYLSSALFITIDCRHSSLV